LLGANSKTNPNPDANLYRRRCPEPNAMIQNVEGYILNTKKIYINSKK